MQCRRSLGNVGNSSRFMITLNPPLKFISSLLNELCVGNTAWYLVEGQAFGETQTARGGVSGGGFDA